jgi:hypothetical protein
MKKAADIAAGGSVVFPPQENCMVTCRPRYLNGDKAGQI